MSDSVHEIELTNGRKAKIKSLNALETIQATSYAGADPSEAVINMVVAVCSVCELDGEKVTPCASKAQFMALAQKLEQQDTVLIGLQQMQTMLAGVSEDQKNELMAMLGGQAVSTTPSARTAGSSRTRAKSASHTTS